MAILFCILGYLIGSNTMICDTTQTLLALMIFKKGRAVIPETSFRTLL